MSTSGHETCRRLFKAERCESCGATPEVKRIERHHLDGNPWNNSAQNIRVLCSRCHMTEDGRLEAVTQRSHEMQKLGAKARTKWKGLICAVEACDRPAKTRGLCNSHYFRARNNGWNPGSTPVRAYGASK